MKIDPDARAITFRQSWLDSAGTCPERARLSVTKPEWDVLDSDEALIGTATHAGIEAYLRGHAPDPSSFAYDYAMTQIDQGRIRWTKRTSIEEIASLASGCASIWTNEIEEMVPQGGRTEVAFKLFLFEHRGWKIYLSGTVDYVLSHEMWDWKTSGWEYKAWEKQRWAIQPTAYAHAAMSGAVHGFESTKWPVVFRYGVMYKPRSKNAGFKSDIVTVTREQSDVDWMFRKIRTFTDLALDALHLAWPMIDNENNLCSSKWCNWWSICKGSHVDESQYATPSQTLPVPKRKVMVAAGDLEQGTPPTTTTKES